MPWAYSRVRTGGLDPFTIKLLGDLEQQQVAASYYFSNRSDKADRTPEPRRGREFIRSWLNIGDEVCLASDGTTLFAAKIDDSGIDPEFENAIRAQIASSLSDDALRRRLPTVPRQPTMRTRQEFYRSPIVSEFAIRRSRGRCEMPGCVHELFLTDRRVAYLEVHHIQPLSERGEDTVENVAALCPSCHRRQHHDFDRLKLKQILLEAVALGAFGKAE